MSISRRHFLGSAALAGVATAAGPGTIPTRVLGRTGARVSILAMGGGSRFLMYKDEDKALEALGRAFDLGITYMDTAYAYGNGQSEERVGKALKARGRSGIFLATKVPRREGDEAMKIIEGSLKRLQTSQVDLIHIHSLEGEDDLAKIEAPGGVLERLMKLRDEKVTRFIGITSHNDPAVLKTALERHDFDCTQMALNAALVGMAAGKDGMQPNHTGKPSFESLALPVANRKKMGVIAMKVFAQERLLGQVPVEKLVYYSMSLPVTTAVIGMPKLEMLEENVRLAKAFQPLSRSEMRDISMRLSDRNKAALDLHFRDHADA